MEVNKEKEAQNSLAGRYLTFALANERYGLEILKVQEIIGVPNITRVPRCPNCIKGVINLRGKIIPLVDLRLKFNLTAVPYDEKTCIVVVNMRREDQLISLGVIVDTVLEVINFMGADIEPPPNYGSQLEGGFIIGMGRKSGSSLNILIDIEQALSASDMQTISEAAK